jgi:hypothetical protein
MENKLTPVEWLVQELINSGLLYPISEMSKTIEQAKEMEKAKEISNEEIEEGSRNYIQGDELSQFLQRTFFTSGAKWYREELRNK